MIVECFSISRRLALTSGILLPPSLSQIIMIGVGVAIATMMVESEFQPCISEYLGAFSRSLNWQVLSFFLYVLIAEAHVSSAAQKAFLQVMLTMVNIAFVIVVVTETEASIRERAQAAMLVVQKDQTIAEQEDQLEVLKTQLLKDKV